MATGISTARANTALDNAITAGNWVQLHVGDPGAAGTSNVAVETTRKQVTMAAASGGTKTSSADLTWTGVAGTEDYTHFTIWSASSAGTFIWSGTITANAVTAGDTFTIASGNFSISIPTAS